MSSRGSALMGRTWVVPDALIKALKQRKVNSKKEMVTLKKESRLMPEKHQPNEYSIPTGTSWQV